MIRWPQLSLLGGPNTQDAGKDMLTDQLDFLPSDIVTWFADMHSRSKHGTGL